MMKKSVAHPCMPQKKTFQKKSASTHSQNADAKKSIRFDTSKNTVHFVHPPPRSRNKEYWFTETQRIVRKGVAFDVEPGINTAVTVTCRLQLCTLAMKRSVEPTTRSNSSSSRSVVSILEEESSLFLPRGVPRRGPRWLAVGSTVPGAMNPVKVVLPPGSYQIRCEGHRPVQVFAQAWDVERELI